MMTCRSCGGDTMVSYSKRSRKQPVPGSAVDLVKRRRKCLRCSEPFYTYERRADDPEEWLGVLEEEKTAREEAERRLGKLLLCADEVALETRAAPKGHRRGGRKPRRLIRNPGEPQEG